MKRTRRVSFLALFTSVMVLFALWSLAPQVIESASLAPSAQDVVHDAWRLAQQSGRYEFSTEVVQTTYPAPKLSHVGRAPREDRFVLAGLVDEPQDTIEMTVWPGGTSPSPIIGRGGQGVRANGLQMRIEGNQAYGRQVGGEWEEMDSVSDVFAQAGDPLGLLSSATNIRLLDAHRQAQGATESQVGSPSNAADGAMSSRYAFDVDGQAFAAYMRDKLERQLRESGELPVGLSIDVPDVYKETSGQGEIWLDESGLPSRLMVQMAFPAGSLQGQDSPVEATFTTDFSNFDRERLAEAAVGLFENPATWAVNHLPIPQTARDWHGLAVELALWMAIAALAFISLTYWQTRPFYVAVTYAVTFSMVFSPLLQSHQVRAFSERFQERVQAQQAYQAEVETQEANREAIEALTQSDFDPYQDPLASHEQDESVGAPINDSNLPLIPPLPGERGLGGEGQASLELGVSTSSEAQSINISVTSSITDTDNDGLSDSDESSYGTDSNDADSDDDGVNDGDEVLVWDSDPLSTDTDSDGLDDGTEVNKLTTDPTSEDTDGDAINDKLEVQGFVYAGQTWYLDPLESDSNHDTQLDTMECYDWTTLSDSYDASAPCPDTDGDGKPDVWDDDNDGDGVVDSVDLSPNQVLGLDTPFDQDNPFKLQLQNLETDKPAFVQLQFRPTTAKHLTYLGNVLDWPVDDDGQITRHLTTTFGTTSVAGVQSDSANANNGDLRLVPLLKIDIPYQAGHYGNLPVIDGAPTITPDMAVDSWLDSSQLDLYGISVRKADDSSGDLEVLVPLTTVTDESGGGLEAFAAQMLYWPSQSNWGNTHEYQLLWMVQLIQDECVTYDTDGDCTAYEDSGVQVIHIYDDEEWYVTGVEVREDHGMEFAIMAEEPSSDTDLTYDDQLWHVGTNLSLTFIEGVDCVPASEAESTCTADGNREVTVASIASSFGAGGGGLWSVSADTIAISHKSYEHHGFLNQVNMTDTVDFLDSTFGSYTSAVPSLLFASEQTARTLNLEDVATADPLVMNLSPTSVYSDVMASLSWVPYRYTDEGTWEDYPIDEYLTYMESNFSQHTDFQPADDSEESAEIAGGQVVLAQLYYLSLYSGLTGWVEANGTAVDTDLDDPTAYDYGREYPYTTFRILSLVSDLAVQYSGEPLFAKVYNLAFDGDYYTDPDGALTKLYKKFNTLGGTISQPKTNFDIVKDIPSGRRARVVAFGAIGVTMASMMTMAVAASVKCEGCNVMFVTASAASGSLATAEAVNLVAKMRDPDFLSKVDDAAWMKGISKQKAFRKTMSANRLSSGAGLAIGLAAPWVMLGVTGGKDGFTKQAIAYAIAQTIVAIVLFMISLIPIVGQIIELLITIVDAIAFLLCETGATDSFCEGLSGLFAEVLADALYDVNEYVDLDNPDRLDYEMSGVSLNQANEGFSILNGVQYTMAITNTIFDVPEYQDGGEKAKKATFEYRLQADETNHHETLQLGDMKNDWVDYTESGRKIVAGYFDITSYLVPFADVGAGINQDLSDLLYLSESFAVPIEECIKYPFYTDCSFKAQKDSIHTEMGSTIVYDILPATLSEFYSLGSRPGGYGLAWTGGESGRQGEGETGRQGEGDAEGGETRKRETQAQEEGETGATFPLSHSSTLPLSRSSSSSVGERLIDADGDGLLSKADGGSDPNDSRWDSDGDGLSDYYELAQGLPPQARDTDGDGLTDKEELEAGTDPLRVDTDGDQLNDKLEQAVTWRTYLVPRIQAHLVTWNFILTPADKLSLRD